MDFVKEIVGRVKWKKHNKKLLINKFVTVSDEALTLLALDNSQFVWEAQVQNKDEIPSPKYTAIRKHRRVKDGWSQQGLEKFNEYFDLIKQSRTNKGREKLEQEYLTMVSGSNEMLTLNDHNSFKEGTVLVTRDDLGNECDNNSQILSVAV